MRRHRREERGGNPSQGPVPELANEPEAPRSDEDFPDAPDDVRAGERPRKGHGDLDDEQLADFAARYGLTSEPDDPSGEDDPSDDDTT